MEAAAGSPISTMNTFGSLAPGNRILAAKSSVGGIAIGYQQSWFMLAQQSSIYEDTKIVKRLPRRFIARNFKEAVSICINIQAGIDELAQQFGGSPYRCALEVLAPVLLTYDRS
ncbi:hypothetical protein G6F57_003946 [Rhizopus arrhizus]|nr:hypothetical protein G6F21_003777 [Rhizopus arrhizus]KAG1425799.1 hypothetical protein G6F58_001777 [Rhizopus delemar]KAG0801427.1 hypothetical protein G6F22_001258 [Rhizopus arrhizus]KAG0817633.1 hypothetical protein G6F20_002223 [Rhizopus arrhizus]KAG0835562.1 hypothetical protein G6F19_004664 [Rhizopus arrhizus]